MRIENLPKFMVEYATRATGEEWQSMPRPAPVWAKDESRCRIKFAEIFKTCFGDTLQFKILGIDTEHEYGRMRI